MSAARERNGGEVGESGVKGKEDRRVAYLPTTVRAPRGIQLAIGIEVRVGESVR